MSVSRRTVTVLFADVADSTPLGERLDAEQLRHVMSRYFEGAREVLERLPGGPRGPRIDVSMDPQMSNRRTDISL